ncbi:MAG: NAD+ synthase [Planctomycetota bacterium]
MSKPAMLQLPPLEPAVVTEVLVRFLQGSIRKFGFRRGVLGVSGGIDSAVAAVLAAKALGPENILGLILPYKLSNPDSERLAVELCKQFNIPTEKIDITNMVDGYFSAAGISADRPADRLRAGNVMARARMIVVFDHSARDQALVIGTSDKTEMLLGYTTWYGDSASAVNPLGDLYKTQVYTLARYLGISKEICDRRPSPDLYPGQMAEEELGVIYDEADALLHDFVDRRLDERELLAKGHRPELLKMVARRVQANQYKRRLPVVAKLSARTVNLDFRYLRDWGR